MRNLLSVGCYARISNTARGGGRLDNAGSRSGFPVLYSQVGRPALWERRHVRGSRDVCGELENADAVMTGSARSAKRATCRGRRHNVPPSSATGISALRLLRLRPWSFPLGRRRRRRRRSGRRPWPGLGGPRWQGQSQGRACRPTRARRDGTHCRIDQVGVCDASRQLADIFADLHGTHLQSAADGAGVMHGSRCRR